MFTDGVNPSDRGAAPAHAHVDRQNANLKAHMHEPEHLP